MRESNRVIYRLEYGEGQPLEQYAKGLPIYDFSNRDTAMSVVLGYSPSDVSPVLATLDSALPVEQLISLTLKQMGRQ